MKDEATKASSNESAARQRVGAALERAGWDIHRQIQADVPYAPGRIRVRGNDVTRDAPSIANYVLSYKSNLPLAVVGVEAVGAPDSSGIPTALQQARQLDLPFAVSSNGHAFILHNLLNASDKPELPLAKFPTPHELWGLYRDLKSLGEEQARLLAQDYFTGRHARYYQRIAVNRTIEAISKGERRVLLTMATGTGKTYVAFQIIWRLWKSGTKKRILFLADRDVLVAQAKTTDFSHFGHALTKITNRKVDKSYEVYLALYQAVTGSDDAQNIYRQFSPDFFDMIVVDECHRGSASAQSAWHQILDYFRAATQLGMTATPKETEEVSNSEYFGQPVYSYSLKQGIEDGFLAPFKVIRIDLETDVIGWRPEVGQVDLHGKRIEDRTFTQIDMDVRLVIKERTQLVARKITQYLTESGDRYAKTIVFCEDIDHAERMREELDAANLDITAAEPGYVVRITGDHPQAKVALEKFTNPNEKYPVIATTSKLMTTGVDAQTCKLIVLDQRIHSVTEFKQIIGRGTRVNEEHGKTWFTIMDFKGATKLFADPEFDGEPVCVHEPQTGGPVAPPDIEESTKFKPDGPGNGETVSGPSPSQGDDIRRVTKYVVNGIAVSVLSERVEYIDERGVQISESLEDYTREKVRQRFGTRQAFLRQWLDVERKAALVEQLVDAGVFFDALAKSIGPEYGQFDLVCHFAFGHAARTRQERVQLARRGDQLANFSATANDVLNALLDKYAHEGIEDFGSLEMLRVHPLNALGTPVELIRAFGGKVAYRHALRELEKSMYQPV